MGGYSRVYWTLNLIQWGDNRSVPSVPQFRLKCLGKADKCELAGLAQGAWPRYFTPSHPSNFTHNVDIANDAKAVTPDTYAGISVRLLSTTFLLVSNLSLFEQVTIYRMLLKVRNRLHSGKGDTIRRGPRVGSAGVNTRSVKLIS